MATNLSKWFHVSLLDARNNWTGNGLVLANDESHAKQVAANHGHYHSPGTSIYEVNYKFAKQTANIIIPR